MPVVQMQSLNAEMVFEPLDHFTALFGQEREDNKIGP